MRIFIGTIFIFLLVACSEIKDSSNEEYSKMLIGNWIPTQLEWDVYNENDSVLQKHKEKNTTVLYFDEGGKGKIIYATVSLREDDSLAFQIDMQCDNISWKKKIGTKEIAIYGIKSSSDNMKVRQNTDISFSVFFNDQKYMRTNKFEHIGVSQIKSCN